MVKMSYYTDYSNYTDEHGVDEDLTAIAHYGGDHEGTNMVGIAVRYMNRSPSYTLDDVASRCCTIQTKKNKHHSPSLEGE